MFSVRPYPVGIIWAFPESRQAEKLVGLEFQLEDVQSVCLAAKLWPYLGSSKLVWNGWTSGHKNKMDG